MISEPDQRSVRTPLQVTLLDRFAVASGGRVVSDWPRPPARRLCELVLVSPGYRVSKELAYEKLFPNLTPPRARKALCRALSLARGSLSRLGAQACGLLRADRTYIWADSRLFQETDFVVNVRALERALEAEPGSERDDLLALALKPTGTLLADEPFAPWTERPRERLDWLRQEARLALARDRAHGYGRSEPRLVTRAWEDCLAHDATCEEAASALMQIYATQGRQLVVEQIYKRCGAALEELGLHVSPSFEEAHKAAIRAMPVAIGHSRTTFWNSGDERRVVTVLFAELAAPPKGYGAVAVEKIGHIMRKGLDTVIAEMEAFGGTVTAVSGAGLVALFGAPEAHEDDPERALRASFRAVAGANTGTGRLSLRVGVETGPAVVGAVGKGSTSHYVAMGEPVVTAAFLQSAARPASVLVGPTTRAAVEGLFDWGPSEAVLVAASGKPLRAYYLARPKLRPSRALVRNCLRGDVPPFGPRPHLSVVREAVTAVTAGRGSVISVAGEAGLGKTVLVEECRSLFMAWVRAAAGRFPLWLEGNGASYVSTTPLRVVPTIGVCLGRHWPRGRQGSNSNCPRQGR